VQEISLSDDSRYFTGVYTDTILDESLEFEKTRSLVGLMGPTISQFNWGSLKFGKSCQLEKALTRGQGSCPCYNLYLTFVETRKWLEALEKSCWKFLNNFWKVLQSSGKIVLTNVIKLQASFIDLKVIFLCIKKNCFFKHWKTDDAVFRKMQSRLVWGCKV